MTPSMPLLAPVALMSKVAVLGRTRDWTWRQVHRASIDLASRLGDASAICNLCSSHLGFVCAMLAGLRHGCPQLLPPSRGNSDLVALLEPGTVIVVDDESLLQPEWLAHSRCLVFRPEACADVSPDADLAWQPDWESPSFRLYTSGSTGKPVAALKTLGQLVHGARSLGAKLDQELAEGFSSLGYLVSSVAPQHMFGLEVSVMLSLVHGLAVLDRRPLLPADVQAAFNIGGHNAAWITTPVHMLALSRCDVSIPNCGVIIASTMPLSCTLAAQIEKQAAAPVLEVYGSTETGALAMRRTALQSDWDPLPEVRIESDANQATAWGAHFESPQTLNDQIEMKEERRFSLLFRKTDLIKIAGRRASLAGLNLLLQDVPDLSDAVFYLPEQGNQRARLVLIYAGTGIAPENIKSYLRGRIDLVFMPRTFIKVERLPRNNEGKLSMRALEEIYQNRAIEKV